MRNGGKTENTNEVRDLVLNMLEYIYRLKVSRETPPLRCNKQPQLVQPRHSFIGRPFHAKISLGGDFDVSVEAIPSVF